MLWRKEAETVVMDWSSLASFLIITMSLTLQVLWGRALAAIFLIEFCVFEYISCEALPFFSTFGLVSFDRIGIGRFRQ